MDKLSKVEISEKEYFDKLAEKYDENYHYLDPFTKYKIVKKASEFAGHIKDYVGDNGLNMLEMGCGTGEYTKKVAKLFPKSKIIGLDISRKIVSVARRKCRGVKNTSFVVKSAYNTGFQKESIDVVFGFYVLHHLSTPKLRKEILRILKPGRLAFFYEPNILNPAVYLVKSNKYLKKLVGDSPNEWAVNPLKIEKDFPGFKLINIITSEFILPMKILPLKMLIVLDKLTSYFRYLPIFKHFGGSVYVFMIKK